MDAQLVIVII